MLKFVEKFDFDSVCDTDVTSFEEFGVYLDLNW